MKAFVQASHGFHIRNLLDTRLFDLLKEEFELVLLADPTDAEHLRREYGSTRVSVEALPWRRHAFEPSLDFVRKRIIARPDRARTISVFSEHEKRTRPLRHTSLQALNAVLGRFSTVRRAWLFLERLLVSGREFDPLLAKHRPGVVVTANYGTDGPTIRLLRAAARMGVPTVTIVPSFDNLTSKGAIAAYATRMIVWNEIMRREATQLLDVPADAVAVCGPVQFDLYADRARWADREAVWRELGLVPTRPTFVVGTITPLYFPYNTDIVEIIAEAIESGQLPKDAQVLVRLHPQVIDDAVFGDDLETYQRLARERACVRLNIPRVRRWGKLRPPARDDMAVLATLLAHAAAVVVPASTLAVDAAVVDTPIVGVGFDGKTVQPPDLSVGRYYDFTHYKPITASGALTVARSPEQLIDALAQALRDRGAQASGRRRLVDAIVGRHDGGAAMRIITEIRAVAAGAADRH